MRATLRPADDQEFVASQEHAATVEDRDAGGEVRLQGFPLLGPRDEASVGRVLQKAAGLRRGGAVGDDRLRVEHQAGDEGVQRGDGGWSGGVAPNYRGDGDGRLMVID